MRTSPKRAVSLLSVVSSLDDEGDIVRDLNPTNATDANCGSQARQRGAITQKPPTIGRRQDPTRVESSLKLAAVVGGEHLS